MADERLVSGRHDLMNGHRALRLGYVGDGERYFRAALLRFRSPELRLGEAHSLRGLAEVALTGGELTQAESWARQAIDAYTSLPALLEPFLRPDEEQPESFRAVRAAAVEGEVTSLALLGEILAKRGDSDAATHALEAARERFGEVEDPTASAGFLMASGRIARREGRIDEALAAFDQAAEVHRAAGQHDGAVVAHLLLAEIHCGQDAVEPAYHALHAALVDARELDQPALEARVLCALGEVALGAGHDVEAGSYFDDALPKARAAGDLEREGQALVGQGCVAGNLNDPSAIHTMYEGICVLARSQRKLGLAGALLRLGNRARRVSAPRLAIASSEIARRMYLSTDPVAGQGQALRTQVKSLAQLQLRRATLMAAIARERLAGHLQPNAGEVAAWFIERADPSVVAELQAMDLQALMDGVRSVVEDVLEPDLELAGIEPEDLGRLPVAVGVLEVMMEDFQEGGGPTRLAVQSAPGSITRAPTEVPVEERGPDPLDEPSELTDGGGYQSLDDMYGSLYES